MMVEGMAAPGAAGIFLAEARFFKNGEALRRHAKAAASVARRRAARRAVAEGLAEALAPADHLPRLWLVAGRRWGAEGVDPRRVTALVLAQTEAQAVTLGHERAGLWFGAGVAPAPALFAERAVALAQMGLATAEVVAVDHGAGF